MNANDLTKEDEDEMVAAVDLVGRSGATAFEVGYLHERREKPDWNASAQYRGARIFVEKKASPLEAVRELARTILTGAKCMGCGRLVALADHGAYAFKETTLADGSTWTWKQARKAGQCRWERVGRRWEMGCRDKN